MNEAPGAEHASGGTMKSGGQRFGLGASGISTEPATGSTTTKKKVPSGKALRSRFKPLRQPKTTTRYEFAAAG
jgi:hypothetical protein